MEVPEAQLADTAGRLLMHASVIIHRLRLRVKIMFEINADTEHEH